MKLLSMTTQQRSSCETRSHGPDRSRNQDRCLLQTYCPTWRWPIELALKFKILGWWGLTSELSWCVPGSNLVISPGGVPTIGLMNLSSNQRSCQVQLFCAGVPLQGDWALPLLGTAACLTIVPQENDGQFMKIHSQLRHCLRELDKN